MLIRHLLVLDPDRRYTATKVRTSLESIINSNRSPLSDTNDVQVVPDLNDVKEEKVEKSDYITTPCRPLSQWGQSKFISNFEGPLNPTKVMIRKTDKDARSLTPKEKTQYQNLIAANSLNNRTDILSPIVSSTNNTNNNNNEAANVSLVSRFNIMMERSPELLRTPNLRIQQRLQRNNGDRRQRLLRMNHNNNHVQTRNQNNRLAASRLRNLQLFMRTYMEDPE